MTMCLENYIGIRGECQEAKLYLDDLQGISIVAASNFTSETMVRPIDLVRKCFSQAQKEVFQDIMSLLKVKFNRIVESKNYKYAGNYSFYGENSEEIKLKIQKRSQDFVNLHVSDFDLVSDRDITKEFVISNGHGSTKVLTVDIVAGVNTIVINEITDSDYISITFDLMDFRIGVKEDYCRFYDNKSCMPCRFKSICDCSFVEIFVDSMLSDNAKIGFNLTVRCEADECALMGYLSPIADLPLLYKTGIFYLLEAKMSGRVNTYLRNTEEAIEHMLTLWMGGYDNAANSHIPSMYWQKVKQISSQVENAFSALNTPVFTFEGSNTCDQLP